MSTSNIDNTQVERSARGIFQTDIVHSRGARLALAGLRLVLGWTFLWAFIDKLFGLGFATPSARAWIDGGTPAQGFMKGRHRAVRRVLPLAGAHLRRGQRLAVHARAARHRHRAHHRLRPQDRRVDRHPAAVPDVPGGVPARRHGPDATFTNPITDSHWIEALGLIVVAATLAGDTLGLGRWWGRRVGRGLLR
ncbi:DoxX family protein [Arsenicicoccus piscis]|uniref:DoxX family protein n=1 Tax=Arsenicicoccus piscis TaxID=673954 RepID=UPI001F4D1A0A|nr:DoxX family protein [Arsenicicoccus piscis]MCH8627748.1 DoxX family protein [Arsenicicoccus piscis]